MGRSRSGYSTYRGRRTFTDVLKIIAGILLLLVVLLVAAMWFGQRYLVQQPDGTVRLELPFFQRDPPAGPQVPDDSDTPDGSSSAAPDGSAQPPDGSGDVTPETPEKNMTAIQLPLSAVLDGSAAQRLEQAGADALVLEVKGEDGKLIWHSPENFATFGDINGPEEVNGQLLQWNQGDVYTVARVCCFRDNTLPYQRNAAALRSPKGNWRDEKGLRWLNPGSEDVVDYLSGLCGELAALGFDEILLDCCTYPVEGKLKNVASAGLGDSQTIRDFLDRMEAAAAPHGAVVSVQLKSGILTGELPGSGLTAERLEAGSGRIWLDGGGMVSDPEGLLTGAGISNASGRFVEVTAQLREGVAWPQAVLNTDAP